MSGTVISIAHTKGGTGKSVLSMHFAVWLTKEYPTKHILLLDADPQATCLKWGRHRAEEEILPYVDVQPLMDTGIKTILIDKRRHYDFIIVDVGGSDNPNLRRVLMYTDTVVIPTSMSQVDRQHTVDFLHLVDEAFEYNESLKVFALFSKVMPVGKEQHHAKEFTVGFPQWLTWINSKIMYRVKYNRGYVEGKTVFDFIEKEVDNKANQEMINAIKAVIGVHNEPKIL